VRRQEGCSILQKEHAAGSTKAGVQITEPWSEGKGLTMEKRTNKREKRHATTTIWTDERGMNKRVER
jgi:hypothetical protein